MMSLQQIIDTLYLAWQRYKLIQRDKGVWANSKLNSGNLAVYYGFSPLPSFDTPVSGGLVKCLDLAREVPNTVIGANLLYLVSSALPLHALQLIRSAKKNGVKVILNQNGVAYYAWHGPGWEKANKCLAAVLHSADFVIYQSKFCKRSADRFLGRVKGPFSIIYNPVDINVFIPGNPLQTQPYTLLIAGTHNHVYRVKLALETLLLLRKRDTAYRLVIAGPFNWIRDEKRAKAEVDSWIHEFNLKNFVEIVGSYTLAQGVTLFQRSAILLHVQYNDACPRLLVESLACGVPVVYSATGGSQEIVGADAGVGIELPLDYQKEHYPAPAALAAGVETILKKYSYFSRAARERAVFNFTLVKWIEKHREVFLDMLK